MPSAATRKVRVHVPMRPSEVVRLDWLARKRDIPRAQLIRELVRKGLEVERAERSSSEALAG